MLTPQQAFRLFGYTTWATLIVVLAALSLSIGWGIHATLPKNKGRRGQLLLKALMSFLVFAMFWGTQASVMIAIFNRQWTPRLIVLFVLPMVVMLIGLMASLAYGVHAILQRTGRQRLQMVLRSLVGVVVFGIGVAPHASVVLMPFISAEDHSNLPGTRTRVGDPVPDFELATVDGPSFRTADLRGRVIVLSFFATWCGPCQMELPHLQAIWNEFRNKDQFTMLVVGCEETDDSVKAFQQERGFTFPMAADCDATVYNQFAAKAIPRTYLISRQGTIIYQWAGSYEEEICRLKKLLRKELARTK